MGHRSRNKSDRAFFALIDHDLHEGDARYIVDAAVDVLPPDAEVTIDHAGLSACDAMPKGADSAELLDVDVDKLARVATFIAPDRFGRLEGTQFVQPEPALNTADGGWRYAGPAGDLLAVHRWLRSRSIFSTTTWVVGRCSRCGRDERCCNPAISSNGPRTDASGFAIPDDWPVVTCRIISSRWRGGRRALLCTFIRWSCPG
jgi:hypothetical protein